MELTSRTSADSVHYWLVPSRTKEEEERKLVFELLHHRKMWGLGDHTRGRKSMRAGDYVCFYGGKGRIIGQARIKTKPVRDPTVISSQFPWVFQLEDVRIFADWSVHLTKKMPELDAFSGASRDDYRWGWFVRAPVLLTKHDFDLLVSRRE